MVEVADRSPARCIFELKLAELRSGPVCSAPRNDAFPPAGPDRLAFPPVNLPTRGREGERRFAVDATRAATVLLVDDEPVSRRANQGRLEDQGYLVTVAENAAEGLTRARQSAPKVIFVHLVGGGLGNVSLIQSLRAEDSCRHIPVVVVTNHRDIRVENTKLRTVNRAGW